MEKNELKHLAIIMDGNGRWAQKQGKKRSYGHKAGVGALERIALHAVDIGVQCLSVYAFSTDNFKRSKEEVDYLMKLFVDSFHSTNNKFDNRGIKVVFSGVTDNLPDDVVESMKTIIEKTKDNQNGVLNICLNYGGQEEIIRASERYHKDLNSGKIKMEEMNRDKFYEYMDNNLPPIDLMIRTGGERRLSNFMLYQMMYAEIYFIDTYFPDFNEKELDDIIDNYYDVDRRFGGINEKERNS
ncbi:MAG: di-trans,poly-cis-decaprenylcistransferase [Bacilli bacterium]|nr:di-trans,poly-cis-decaprenylcistransferase [Bacilli bacterium]